MINRCIFALLLLTFALPSDGAERSEAVRHAFQLTHPCPSNSHNTGKCPGYVKDHIIPLCIGGPDSVLNMQWQTLAASYAKDRYEYEMCAAYRRLQKHD